MQEDTNGKKKKRRRKKSKFGYYLYAITVLLLTIINITLATLLLTKVQGIEVKGTKYSQESDIVTWIEEDPMTNNSLYTLWKFKLGHYTLPVYLEDVEVSLTAPWKVKVKVREKQMIGCILVGNSYVYFDAEGLVLKKGSEYDTEIPLIEGLTVKDSKLFEYLKVENKKVFSYIVKVTEEIAEADISPDRLVWENDSMNLYFEQICVKLGKTNFAEKILQLPPILTKLEGKQGTLQMEHYTEDSKNISFEKSDEES
ncbi:MAG: hypothetical protein IJA54_01590 [Tyzzerella sp.]|nr:hypothetical protein [Tyzzerella sp.]